MLRRKPYQKVPASPDDFDNESTPLYSESNGKQRGWSTASIVVITLTSIVGAIGLILGAIALHQNNTGFFPAGANLNVGDLKSTGHVDFSMITKYTEPAGIVPGGAPITSKRGIHKGRSVLVYDVQPGDQNIILGNHDVTYDIRFPSKMGSYVQKSYVIFSNTSNPHTIRFTGELSGDCSQYAQTTFDAERIFPVAQFEPRVGGSIEFKVVDCGTIFRRDSRYVNFCTEDLSVCSHPEENVNATWLFSQMTKVDGMLDTSKAQVKPAPEFIVVGQAQPGVNSWPVSLNKRMDDFHKKAHKSASRMMDMNKRNPTSQGKRLLQTIPTFPSFLNTIPLPPANAVHVDTIHDALKLLYGKVVTNTTIFLHAGEYRENVILDGFVSNCDASLSTDLGDTTGPLKCAGLNFIGDARILAGKTVVNGHYREIWEVDNILLGTYGSRGHVECLNSTSIKADRPPNEDFQTNLAGFVFYPFTVDYVQLGLVPGDKILISDGDNRGFHQEKTVTAVSGSTISFAEPGCFASGLGAAVTFLPNRRIVGQAKALTGNVFFPPFFSAEEQFETVSAALNVQVQANVRGLYVYMNETTSPYGINMLTPCMSSSGPYLDGLVCRSQVNSPAALFMTGQADSWTGSPNFEQYTQESHNISQFETEPVVRSELGHITLIDGQYYTRNSYLTVSELVLLGKIANIHLRDNSFLRAESLVAVSDGTTMASTPNSVIETNTCMMLSGNIVPVRLGTRGKFRVNYNIAKIGTKVAGNLCFFGTEESSIQMIEDFPLFLLGQPDAFELLNCSVYQYNLLDTSKLRIDAAPLLTNAAAKGIASQSASVILQGMPIAPFSDINANDYDISKDTNYLTGSSAQALTLSQVQRDLLVGRTMKLYAKTAHNHTLTLTEGATWDGVNTIATFSTVGSGLTYHVIDENTVALEGSNGVTFSA